MTIEGITYHKNGNKQMQIIHTKYGFDLHKWFSDGKKKQISKYNQFNELQYITQLFQTNGTFSSFMQYKKDRWHGFYIEFIYENN